MRIITKEKSVHIEILSSDSGFRFIHTEHIRFISLKIDFNLKISLQKENSDRTKILAKLHYTFYLIKKIGFKDN